MSRAEIVTGPNCGKRNRVPAVGGAARRPGIPTMLILREGREVARQVGAVPPPALLRWTEEVITDQQPGDRPTARQ